MTKIIFWIIFIALITEIAFEILMFKLSWKKRLIIGVLLIIALFTAAYSAY